jgi:hypothetical protein
MVGCAAERCGGTIVNPLIAIAIKRSFFIDFPFYHKIFLSITKSDAVGCAVPRSRGFLHSLP